MKKWIKTLKSAYKSNISECRVEKNKPTRLDKMKR